MKKFGHVLLSLLLISSFGALVACSGGGEGHEAAPATEEAPTAPEPAAEEPPAAPVEDVPEDGVPADVEGAEGADGEEAPLTDPADSQGVAGNEG